LAFEIVEIFQGPAAARAADLDFRKVHQEGELPAAMPELRLLQPSSVLDILTNSGLVASKSEVRRLAQQGGIKLDGERVADPAQVVGPAGEHVLQIGKRKFLKLVGA